MTQADLTLPAPRTTIAEWLTVERVAYGCAALLALCLRLYGLGARGLLPAEAAQAWQAWQAAAGHAYDVAGLSPLLFNLQRLFIIPFGGSDALPRWPVALLGGLAPLLFYALRDRLGRGGALVAAFLWACSPLAVFFGRLGLSYGLVPVLALALLAGINLYFAQRAPRWLVLAAVVFGLLLAAGPGAYTVVLTGLLAALIWRPAWGVLGSGIAGQRRSVALAVVLALALGATGFLTALPGLASTFDMLGRWLRALSPGGPSLAAYDVPYSAWDLARRLLISEPLLVVAGLAGLLLAWRRRAAFGLLAGLGLAVSLAVALLGPGRQPGDLTLVVLALVLLAGPVIARILALLAGWGSEVDPWLMAILSLVLLTSAAISLPSAFAASPDEGRRLYIAVGLVTSVMLVILWVTFTLWGSAAIARRVLPVLGLLIGGIWAVSQLVGLSYTAQVAHYSGVLAQVAGPGWVDLRDELANLSPLHGTGKNEAAIDLWVTGPGAAGGQNDPLVPMLLWELKDHPNLSLVTGLPAVPAPLIITPVGPGARPDAGAPAVPAPAVPATYSGTSLDLLETWRPESLTGFDQWLRWLLYREVPNTAAKRDAVLWVDQGAGQPAPGSFGVPGLPQPVPNPAPAGGAAQ